MDSVISLLAAFASTEDFSTLISIALAAVVFFYFVHLLRKKEAQQETENESASHRLPNKA